MLQTKRCEHCSYVTCLNSKKPMFKQFFEDLLLGNEEAVENGISVC